jgi:hypothetical protein
MDDTPRIIMLGLARWVESHGRFRRQVEKGEGLLQIESNAGVSVTRVADGDVLPEVKIEVAAASGDDESAVDSGSPDDFALDQAFHMLENRIPVITRLGKFGISIGAEQDRVRAVDTHETQLAQCLRKGFWILANVSGKWLFGITGALPDPYDSSGGVAFEDGAVFGKGQLPRSVLCGLPIRVICTAFYVVHHLTLKLKRHAQLDDGLYFALLSRNAISGRLDRTLMACAHCSQRCALRAVNIRNAAAGKIPLDRA